MLSINLGVWDEQLKRRLNISIGCLWSINSFLPINIYYYIYKLIANTSDYLSERKLEELRTLSLCIVGAEFRASAVYSPDGMWQTRTRLCAEAPLVWRQARDNGGRDVTISCSAGARKWHCLLNTRPSFQRRAAPHTPFLLIPSQDFPSEKLHKAQSKHFFTLWHYILRVGSRDVSTRLAAKPKSIFYF